jgi:hypothetical protein
MPQLTTLIDKFLRRLSMTDAEKLLLRNDLSVINANRTNVNFAVPGPYTNDADAYANGVGYGEMYRKPDGSLSWIFEDIDAQLYLAEVQAALGATTIEAALPNATNPRKIISDFYRAEKDAGRWSLFKQFHLPIYNNAAANAIDLVARYVGEFSLSGVTPAAGYVQSDGLSGYFDFKNTPVELGLSMSDAYQFALAKTAFGPTSARVIGSRIAAGQDFNLTALDGTSFRSAIMSNSSGAPIISSSNAMTGILTSSRKSGVRFVGRRSSGGYENLGSITNSDVGLTPDIDIYAMAGNTLGTAASFTNNQWGSYGVGLGLTDTQNSGFTGNLKTLWENLTGLTLP